MLLTFAPGTSLADLFKAYIHGHYRRHPNGQQVWVDSYSDKRPEKHRTEFAHWQHRIEHFKDYLSQGHTREALHAFHDLGHDDSHKLARDLGLHDDGPEFADKKTLMGAVHGRILARKQELQAKVGAQVKADFEKRKAAGLVGKQSKSPERVNGASHANTAPLGDAVSRDVQRDGVSGVSGTTGDAPGDAITGVQRPDQPVNPWQVKSEYAKGELVRPHLDSMERWLMPPIAYRRQGGVDFTINTRRVPKLKPEHEKAVREMVRSSVSALFLSDHPLTIRFSDGSAGFTSTGEASSHVVTLHVRLLKDLVTKGLQDKEAVSGLSEVLAHELVHVWQHRSGNWSSDGRYLGKWGDEDGGRSYSIRRWANRPWEQEAVALQGKIAKRAIDDLVGQGILDPSMSPATDAAQHRALAQAHEKGIQVAPELVADHPELAPKAEAPAKAKDTVTMSKQELIAEHEKLVAVLKSPDHADDLEEAKEQEKELKGYKGGDAKAAKPKATPPDATDISPAEAAEAERQYQEVKARYQGTPGWLKAPNGKPSKLNERQWVLARTPNFKRWFGDWEVAANLAFIDAGDPVASMSGNEVPVFDKIGKLASWVADFWERKYQGKATHPVLGDVALDRKAASTSLGHGIGRTKAQAFYLVHAAIEKGVLLGRLPPQPAKPPAYLIAAPVMIGDKAHKMLVEVRELQDKNRMYIHEVVLQKEVASVGEFISAATPESGNQPHGPHHGAIYSFVENLRKVNPSKVVDANGEPLVLYHGTKADFSMFNEATQGKNHGDESGFFFTSNPGNAGSGYADGEGGNVMPVSLSLKNPLVIKSDKFNSDRIFFADRAKIMASVRLGRNDGIIVEDREGNKTFVAFRPAQVKSAIGNTGTFRPDLAHLSKAWLRTPIFFRNARIH